MLEICNVTKIYHSKHGVNVTAVDNVSIRFPETGMVFLLGKSGSGKSTLLNLLGGLDRYDSGEIRIHGTSIKDFKDSMMDSYRNTYLGFVFQRYNLMYEFTVRANIALAIELQGNKATAEEIERILKMVGLEGLADRKPNELSGGQLQRVAIARALVKNPDIILADEPTGALDSNTGKQIFDLLKELSKTKLVIVVSHDREYSEQYADRIIELSDGHIISDVEACANEKLDEPIRIQLREDGMLELNEEGITVSGEYELTEEERKQINQYLMLRKDKNLVVKDRFTAEAIHDQFHPTDLSKQTESDKKMSLIRSKLPWKQSFGIALNSLKYKKIMLIFTILLSVISFSLFCLADELGSFDKGQCIAQTVQNSGVKYIDFNKQQLREGWMESENLTEEDIEKLESEIGTPLLPIYSLAINMDNVIRIEETVKMTDAERSVYPMLSLSAIVTDSPAFQYMEFPLLCGSWPEKGKHEICISDALAKAMLLSEEELAGKSMEDLIGYQISQRGFRSESESLKEMKYNRWTISGIVNESIDAEQYVKLLEESERSIDEASRLKYQIYTQIAISYIRYGLPSCVFVTEEDLCELLYTNRFCLTEELIFDESQMHSYGITSPARIPSQYDVWLLNGKTVDTLEDDEIVVPAGFFMNIILHSLNQNRDGVEITAENIPDIMKLVNANPELISKMPELKIDDFQKSLRIVGFYLQKEIPTENTDEEMGDIGNTYNQFCIVSDSLYEQVYAKLKSIKPEISTLYVKTPDKARDVLNIATACEKLSSEKINYSIVSFIYGEMELVDELVTIFRPTFTSLGIFMAIFATMLFSVFIGNSISYKKREIGILRAIGARRQDVFRIFMSESGMIALVNGLLVFLVVSLATSILNRQVMFGALNIALLHFGIRQILLVLALSFGFAFIATVLPVWLFARKNPVDIITDR